MTSIRIENTSSKFLTQYLTPNTEDWKVFLKRLFLSTKKSNRDVLCLKCWRILSQDSRSNHMKNLPSHTQSIVTSKFFATEAKFVETARNWEKYQIVDGVTQY